MSTKMHFRAAAVHDRDRSSIIAGDPRLTIRHFDQLRRVVAAAYAFPLDELPGWAHDGHPVATRRSWDEFPQPIAQLFQTGDSFGGLTNPSWDLARDFLDAASAVTDLADVDALVELASLACWCATETDKGAEATLIVWSTEESELPVPSTVAALG